MSVRIRKLRRGERSAWLALRARLWPDTRLQTLRAELEEILADRKTNAVFLAHHPSRGPVGFAEVALRDWAEGCATRPVGYIEAWYVLPGHRREGIGGGLIKAAETWALAQGCSEMGSDADFSNKVSRRAHAALGYREVACLTLFARKLSG